MAANPQTVTLTAATVATLTFDADFSEVEITNVDGSDVVYIRFDGVAPVAKAAGNFMVPAVEGASSKFKPHTNGNTVVKLISAGTPTVHVRGTIPA